MEESGATTTATIFDLPFEDIVMTHIVKHLDMSDLLNLRCCSRAFQDLAERIFGGKTALDIGNIPKKAMPVIAVAGQYCERLRIIHLDFGIEQILHDEDLDKVIHKLISKNQFITEFRFSFGDSGAPGTQTSCTTCTSKKLCLLTQCKELVHFELKNMNLDEDFLKIFASDSLFWLQHLHLNNVRGFKGKTLANFIAKQPNLRSIAMVSLSIYVGTCLNVIAKVCKQLETLDIRNSRGVYNAQVLRVARNCPKIRAIYLRMSSDAFDPVFDDTFYSYSSTHMRANISDETLQYLVSRNIARR